MGHLLKCVDSAVNVHILASTIVPFTLTTMQVPNLALIYTKRITVQSLFHPFSLFSDWTLSLVPSLFQNIFAWCWSFINFPEKEFQYWANKKQSSEFSFFKRNNIPPWCRRDRQEWKEWPFCRHKQKLKVEIGRCRRKGIYSLLGHSLPRHILSYNCCYVRCYIKDKNLFSNIHSNFV